MPTRVQFARDVDGLFYGIRIKCPGCDAGWHVLPVSWLPQGESIESPHAVGKPHWSFNGNFERPTLSPSILSRHEHGTAREMRICHSFVDAGLIQFLNDCTHALAGQTVELPEIE